MLLAQKSLWSQTGSRAWLEGERFPSTYWRLVLLPSLLFFLLFCVCECCRVLYWFFVIFYIYLHIKTTTGMWVSNFGSWPPISIFYIWSFTPWPMVFSSINQNTWLISSLLLEWVQPNGDWFPCLLLLIFMLLLPPTMMQPFTVNLSALFIILYPPWPNIVFVVNHVSRLM